MAEFSARLFGPFEIALADGRVLGAKDFGGVKPKQLLEILLVEHGHPVSKDRLADLLWGDSLPRNVAATLETYVSLVRKRLASPDGSSASPIVTERGAYRLEGTILCDLDRFDELVAAAERSDPLTALDHWEEALALASGDVIADEPYAEWALEVRDRYRARVVGACNQAARLALGAERPADAVAHAERAIALDAVSEAAYRWAMLGQYVQRHRADALRMFDRCAAVFKEELGVEPLPETRAVRDAIAGEQEADVLLARLGVPLLSRAASAEAGIVPFLGRQSELLELESAVNAALAGRFSLLFVEGEAGIGKTRVLEELTDRLPHVRLGRARCSELESELPYIPLIEALEEVVDDGDRKALAQFFASTDADARLVQLETLEALVELVRRNAPFVLVIDDLHWASKSTVIALGYIHRRCQGSGVAVVGSYRMEEVGLDHLLRRLDPTLDIVLEPLTAADLAPVEIDGLLEKTGGHPFFVAACIEEDHEENGQVTERVARAVQERCRAAGDFGYRVLVAASVMPGSFAPEMLARVIGSDPVTVTDELERLCRRRLLRTVGNRFDFRYHTMREALQAAVSPSRVDLLSERALLAREDASEPVIDLAGAERGTRSSQR